MADSWYRQGAHNVGGGVVDLSTDPFQIIGIDETDYTADIANDATLSDVPAAARVFTAALDNESWTNAVLDADDEVISALTGDGIDSLIITVAGASDALSYLLFRFDSASGLPLTPDGTDVNITFNAGGIMDLDG